MNQVLENPAPAADQPEAEQTSQGIEDKAKALESLGRAESNLGQVASGREVHTDASGVVLTPREVAEHRNQGTADDIRV